MDQLELAAVIVLLALALALAISRQRYHVRILRDELKRQIEEDT